EPAAALQASARLAGRSAPALAGTEGRSSVSGRDPKLHGAKARLVSQHGTRHKLGHAELPLRTLVGIADYPRDAGQPLPVLRRQYAVVKFPARLHQNESTVAGVPTPPVLVVNRKPPDPL